jgi:ribokinase
MRCAVIGHVEWVEFAHIDQFPQPGDIIEAESSWQEAAGGGAVAAVQLRRLAGEVTLFTALGDDELGQRSRTRLTELGVRVEAVMRRMPQRRAFTLVQRSGERTITVIGPRLEPSLSDPLAWEQLASADAIYFTAGDTGALSAASQAGVLVATPRAGEVLFAADVRLDALVLSSNDQTEQYQQLKLARQPKLVVTTQGEKGGSYVRSDGSCGRYDAVVPQASVVDTYGCGDSFAAGLTYGLGSHQTLTEALRTAARCGSACLTGSGPYEGQLRFV